MGAARRVVPGSDGGAITGSVGGEYPISDDPSMGQDRVEPNSMIVRAAHRVSLAMDYQPPPIDTSTMGLGPELLELTERLAENAYEVWAARRLEDGWRHRARRDDAKKEHPCLVSYDELPESEKVYDRVAALKTLGAIVALGFRIEPPAPTVLPEIPPADELGANPPGLVDILADREATPVTLLFFGGRPRTSGPPMPPARKSTRGSPSGCGTRGSRCWTTTWRTRAWRACPTTCGSASSRGWHSPRATNPSVPVGSWPDWPNRVTIGQGALDVSDLPRPFLVRTSPFQRRRGEIGRMVGSPLVFSISV
jgi:RyR domain